MKLTREGLERSDGREVWICDYHFRDPSKKLTRAIKPQKVLVRVQRREGFGSYTLRPTILFATLKEGSTISFEDNTCESKELSVFTDELECRQEFTRQLRKACQELQTWRNSVNTIVTSTIVKFEALIVQEGR
jgi:hypothetical protein